MENLVCKKKESRFTFIQEYPQLCRQTVIPLDAQKARMKAFADYNDYEIVGAYEDIGKSGKFIEGRLEFNRMTEDIKSGKDGVSFVLVNAICTIFEQCVNTDIGADGVAKYLENHGIYKIQRQNGKNPLLDAHLVCLILRYPVYCGKIAYGRRKTEKVKVYGTRSEYHLVESDNYILVDGRHEAISAEDIWQAAQVKLLLAQAKKYEHVNKAKDTRTHLLKVL